MALPQVSRHKSHRSVSDRAADLRVRSACRMSGSHVCDDGFRRGRSVATPLIGWNQRRGDPRPACRRLVPSRALRSVASTRHCRHSTESRWLPSRTPLSASQTYAWTRTTPASVTRNRTSKRLPSRWAKKIGGKQLLALAKDIVEEGVDPTNRTVVVPSEDQSRRYIVLEGNRRLLALKALDTPALVASVFTPSEMRSLDALSKRYLAGGPLTRSTACCSRRRKTPPTGSGCVTPARTTARARAAHHFHGRARACLPRRPAPAIGLAPRQGRHRVPVAERGRT